MKGSSKSLLRIWRTILEVTRSRRFILVSIAFPLLLRAIPEILAGPWPLGFDTVLTYAPFVRNVEARGFASAFVDLEAGSQVAPLVYLLLGIAGTTGAGTPFVVVKVAAPLLYALFGLCLYYFARVGLHWTQGRALFLVIFTVLYFVPLRFSWDMYKNLLGYSLFLLALTHLTPRRGTRDSSLLLLFGALCILSSELTAALIGGVGLVTFLWELAKDRHWNVPAILLSGIAGVAVLFYLGALFPLSVTPSPLSQPSYPVTVPYNYVGANQDAYIYMTGWDVYATVLVLSLITLVPLVPLALCGRIRDRRVVAWTLVLIAGAYSILVWPFAAFPLWHRWLLMLVFPVLLFAAEGIWKVARGVRFGSLVVVVILAATFITLPPQNALPYYASPRTVSLIPTSMLQNTVPLDTCIDVVQAIAWLNALSPAGSVVVAPPAFIGWAQLYLERIPSYGFGDPSQVNQGNFSDYSHVFLLYWALQEAWYDSRLMPDNATEVHLIGTVAVYEIAVPTTQNSIVPLTIPS